MWFKKKETPAYKQMIDWLSVESITYNPEDGTNILMDIKRDDIKAWLYAITKTIQASYSKNPIIKNWISGQMSVAGQDIEFYIMKKGGESPLKLLTSEKEKVKLLEKKLEDTVKTSLTNS